MIARPTSVQLKEELKRTERISARFKTVRFALGVLLISAAAAVLCATFVISVLCIRGGSMEPALSEDQYVIAVRSSSFDRGDIIAFYYNNQILLKRVIGAPGDVVDVNADGSISVNGELLDDPYAETAGMLGDIEYPYKVPEDRWFVLGDHRDTSLDSRYSVMGNVSTGQVEGKVMLRIWPAAEFGPID